MHLAQKVYFKFTNKIRKGVRTHIHQVKASVVIHFRNIHSTRFVQMKSTRAQAHDYKVKIFGSNSSSRKKQRS